MLERIEAEVLLTLAQELHFGRTAERLRLTTSQVSRTVKSVERRLGTALFTRTSRVVTLTAIGARLVADLEPHVRGMDAAVRGAMEAGRQVRGTLRVAFVGAAAGQLLLKAAALFGTRHPDCEVRIHEAQVHDACERVFDGSVDVLITALPVRGVRVGPVLLSEPQVLALPHGHRLAGRTQVTREVFGDYPVIRLPDTLPEESRLYRVPAATPAGRPVRQGPQGGTFSEILALVASRQGVFPVGEHAARFYPRPGVTYVPLGDAPPVRWAPVWLETNETGSVRAFVTCAAETARDEPGGAGGPEAGA
ncbi:LysR family transcriptional regulator [Streptomyces qinglanensis]|uniref:LysR family transcriptional regulator n=1 Tax=Streptomyces qinglanensis TaxID=943816 RepID=UPI000943B8AB|nr:LysR family transcriptional regulator [Streptomyces qinglanensis]